MNCPELETICGTVSQVSSLHQFGGNCSRSSSWGTWIPFWSEWQIKAGFFDLHW